MVGEQSVNGNPFDLVIDPQQFSNDTPRFLGVVVIDQVVPGSVFTTTDGNQRETGPQWQLGIKPVQFTIQGETGAYITWFTPTTKKNSKTFAIIKAMADLPSVFPKGQGVAKGNLIGIVCWWVRRDIEFGNTLARNVLIPVAEATEEEIAEAKEVMREAGAVTNGATSYTDEEVSALINVLDGKSVEDAQIAAARNQTLPSNLKQGILSGEAVTYLAGHGMIDVDTSGKISRVSTEEKAEVPF